MKKRENKNYIIALSIIIGLFTIAMLLSYFQFWKPAMNKQMCVYTSNSTDKMISLKDGDAVSQTVTLLSNTITGFGIKVDYLADGESYEAGKYSKIEIQLWKQKDNECINKWEYCFENVEYNDFLNIYFDSPLKVDRNSDYKIKIIARKMNGGCLNIYLGASNAAVCKSAKINNNRLESPLSYNLYKGNCNDLKYVWFFILFMGIMLISFYILKNMITISIQTVFVIVTMIIGIIYMVILPPFSVPDEASHFISAYNEASIIMGKDDRNEDGIVLSDKNSSIYFVREERPTASSYQRYFEELIGKSDETLTKSEPTRRPLFSIHFGYIPQVCGIIIARIIHCSAGQIMLFGQFFALLFYCFVMYWTIKIIPIWKEMVFIIGLFPICVQQVASYNYDSVLFALCFFSFGYLMYLKFDKVKIGIIDYSLMIILLIAIISIKYIYVIVFGLAFLIPDYKFGGKRNKYVAGILSILNCIAMIFLLMIIKSFVSRNVPITSTVSDLQNYSISYILKHLIPTVGVILNTLLNCTPGYVDSMVANDFGWCEITIPSIVSYSFLIITYICVKKDNKVARIEKKEKMWIVILNIVLIGAVILALLITYTYVGASEIIGVQGRYFIPIVPLLAILFSNNKNILVNDNKVLKVTDVFFIVLQLYTIWCITNIVVVR